MLGGEEEGAGGGEGQTGVDGGRGGGALLRGWMRGVHG